MTLVYVDTESTGLDPERHEIWEMAFAVGNLPVVDGIVHHSLRNADPAALTANGYWTRSHRVSDTSVETRLREVLPGATLVAANPAFDAGMLKARWGFAPWHYRLFDVEAFAAGILRHPSPKSLRDIAEELRGHGFDIPTPNHTAAGDVETLRACHKALVEYQAAYATL